MLPPALESALAPIRWFFIIVDILMVAGFIYSLMKVWHMIPPYIVKPPRGGGEEVPTLKDAVIRERWRSITKRFALGTPEAARIAVIDADALVDAALKNNLELPGEHLADRLTNLEAEDVATLNRVWRAHRLRNDLVHTPGFVISVQDAEGALADYEAFLKEIGIL